VVNEGGASPDLAKRPKCQVLNIGDWYELLPGYALATRDDQWILVSPSSITTGLSAPGTVGVHRSRFEAYATMVPLFKIVADETCLFTENQCKVTDARFEPSFLIGQITAQTINVSNNRLIGASPQRGTHRNVLGLDATTADNKNKFVVVGNISTGPIVDVHVPKTPVALSPPWLGLNLTVS
jgi:hypothetical protein